MNLNPGQGGFTRVQHPLLPTYKHISLPPCFFFFLLHRVFLTTLGAVGKELLQTCRALQVYLFFKFQVSSNPCVWSFHLFSFKILASFKNKRRTEKSEEENSYFFLLLLHFVSCQKKLQYFEARDLLFTEKRMRCKKSIVSFYLVLFARSSHQHMF